MRVVQATFLRTVLRQGLPILLVGLTVVASGTALAEDVTRPAEVSGLLAARAGADVELQWGPVTLDVAGQPEIIDYYKVYRGGSPSFVPDMAGGSNLIGTTLTEQYSDLGAAADANDYYYLVSAVDTAGNESNTKSCLITTVPTLSGFWTNTTIELDWTDAEPDTDLLSYRVYYGKESRQYEFVDDVGVSTSHSLATLTRRINWYFAVTAVDVNGNETVFSNEHIEAVGGVVKVRALDAEELCWGGDCLPNDGSIHRVGGWQVLRPVDFPEGEWVSVTVKFTVDSRLCMNGQQGTVNKCGTGNPCVSPPCNGGYNPCGDPWDRGGHLFMVLDDCINAGGSCRTNDNLELMRVVTPFGTDAEPPNGTGFVPPRALTLDVTPYVPLFTGTRWIGAEIGHYVQKGWWVTADFEFSERPEQTSPKPPADGIQIVGYSGAPLPTRQVTVPASATSVKMRLFTTGHGGSLYCNGGTNDGLPCTINGSTAECPGGGICWPCDEFCRRMNRIYSDGTPVWEFEPYRTDCTGSPTCATWNACGYPSCTYSRAGWCPGYMACHHNAPCDNDLDMTTAFSPGGTYDVDYDVTPMNGSWPVSLVLYWYE
jgi:hypothetical protein